MTPVEKAAAIMLAADNMERAFHSALHTLRELGAPGAEAMRLHQSTFSAASAAADDIAEALKLADEALHEPNIERFETAGTLFNGEPS